MDRVEGLEEAEKEKCEGVMAPDNSSTDENRNGKETAGRLSTEERDMIGVEFDRRGDNRKADRSE